MDPTTSAAPSAATKTLGEGFSALGFALQERLPSDENLFFSPLSIGAALAALLPGARNRTATELSDVLGATDVMSVLADTMRDP